MKHKIFGLFGLSVLILIMIMSLASAANVFPTDISGNEPTINHGDEVTITFKIQNNWEKEIEHFEIILPSFAFGSWTSAKLGSTTLTIDENKIDVGNLNIKGGATATSDIFTLIFTSNKYTIPNTYEDEITFYGDYKDGSPDFTTDNILLSITIDEDKSLAIEITKELTKIQNGTIKITNTGNVELTNIKLEMVSTSPDFSVDFGSITPSLIPGIFQEIVVSSTNIQNLELGDDNTITIRATSDKANSSIITLKVPVSFCDDCENLGNLKINDFDLSVDEGFGDDEEYWYPLDKVEVEFDVENNGKWDIENIEIEVCLFDVDEGECVMDEDDMDLSDNDFDLDEDEDKTITLSFIIDPNDLNEGNTDYEIYLGAKGKIDDKDAEENDGEETCASDSKEIEIRIDENFIILSDFNYPEIVQCGAEVTISFDAWNIGEDKIDEDEIFINVYNDKLAINELIKVNDDIKALDNEKIEFTFNVPKSIDEEWYTIEFRVYDDEDCSNSDIYENSENEESKFEVILKVEGNCEVGPKAVVSATLESGGEAGEELVVKAIIKNTGDELAIYTLTADSYSEWATSLVIEPSTVVLSTGDSREVLITLIVNNEATGDKLFNIVATSDGEEAVKQPVSFTITESEASGISGITGKVFAGEGNTYLWGIAILNIILVIIIIIVAVRVAGR